MIETVTQGNSVNTLETSQTRSKNNDEPIFRMKKHSRMAGSVPVWESQKTVKDNIQSNLAHATQEGDDFNSALAYAGRNNSESGGPEPFGFDDIIDMVNPLQHIPLVNRVYRHVTGDEIQPVSKIIGGSIYGGPAGAAVGIADTISEYETGRDMLGNAVHVARGGSVEMRSTADHPEKRLNEAAQINETTVSDELPGSALSFVDLGYGKQEVIKHVPIADGRTAGTMIQRSTEVLMPEPIEQDPIETLALKPMPPRYEFKFNS